MAEFTEGMSRDIGHQIIKGKRTKRHRPSSPLGNGDGGDCFIDGFDEPKLVSTKEDEDIANCLIMLARSVSPVTEEKYSGNKLKFCFLFRDCVDKTLPVSKVGAVITHQSLWKSKTTNNKFPNKFFMKAHSSGSVMVGLAIFECKTCNRTFPSFQALGGHRASHKKPKVNVEEKISSSVNYNNNTNNIIITQPQPPLMEYVEEDNDVEVDEENKASIINNTNNVQNGTNMMINHNNTTKGGGKVHECSICGSEFLSGQALGGHMRKHRPIPHTGNRTTGISTTTDDTEMNLYNMLSLDLNFPPPEVVEDHFSQQQQQHRMVFSAPAFVDCHY
ncbi:zinc finger protein ZAT5-like [Bidens hawaiensis]|uniref:zinc finger protein ZAT5-like n=1 Tax=Bidens hawaiensis TaxID=980011 RepID=UPI004049A850